MLIAGAKGHAKELLDVIRYEFIEIEDLCFYDDISDDIEDSRNGFLIIKKSEDLGQLFKKDNRFILGVGSVRNRLKLFNRLVECGGEAVNIVSTLAFLSKDIRLGIGLNIMPYSAVFSNVEIGSGTLINSFSSVHHDAVVGKFVEVSPGARILGRTKVGDYSSIGSNACVLPDRIIGSNVIVAAGAVVTMNVPDNCLVAGVPAQIKKKIEKFEQWEKW